MISVMISNLHSFIPAAIYLKISKKLLFFFLQLMKIENGVDKLAPTSKLSLQNDTADFSAVV